MQPANGQPVIEVLPRVYRAVPAPQRALEELQAELYAEVRAKGRPVRQLVTALLDRRNLYAAWRFVRSNDGADTPGVDGMTCKELDQSEAADALPRLFEQISHDILHGCYRPHPPRWVDVPKPDGGTRRLGILTVRDRIVHAALKNVLEPILEPVFTYASFGFRPGRSTAAALYEVLRYANPDDHGRLVYPYAMHLDIKDCFDTVDHTHLFAALSEHVADATVLQLLRQLLQACAHRARYWFRTYYVGLLQGSVLSPLLCNLALHTLDREMLSMRSATQKGIVYFRYADDLLMLARTEELARKAFRSARAVLQSMGQHFGVRKPNIVHLSQGVDWLGVRIRVSTNPWTGKLQPGFVIPDERVREMIQRLHEMTVPPSAKLSEQTFDLGQWIISLNRQLTGWHTAYQFADNFYEVARTLDDVLQRRFEELLMAVTGKGRQYVRGTYRTRLLRGFSTWQVDGQQLMVLSSEAPRCPNPKKLNTRPAWMRPPHSIGSPEVNQVPWVQNLPPQALPQPAGQFQQPGGQQQPANPPVPIQQPAPQTQPNSETHS